MISILFKVNENILDQHITEGIKLCYSIIPKHIARVQAKNIKKTVENMQKLKVMKLLSKINYVIASILENMNVLTNLSESKKDEVKK